MLNDKKIRDDILEVLYQMEELGVNLKIFPLFIFKGTWCGKDYQIEDPDLYNNSLIFSHMSFLKDQEGWDI